MRSAPFRLALLLSFLPAGCLSFSSVCFGELKLDLPSRYLHIQLIEDDGRNSTESKGALSVNVEAPGCRFSHNNVDKEDGSYIFWLRIIGSCPRAIVTLKVGGVTVCESPIEVKGIGRRYLNGEDCNCPIPIDKWLETAKCAPEPQIEKDLSQWGRINFEEVLWAAEKRWGGEGNRRSYSVCHYQIIENKIHRRCFGEYDGFKRFFDKALQSILNKIKIPNTEFIFNLGDYPLSYDENLPLVSWCGSKETKDIVLPTYELMEKILQEGSSMWFTGATPSIKWSEKIAKAVFRGRDSNNLRLKLAKMTSQNPEGLLDAGITAYFFHDVKEHTPIAPRIRFNDFFKHKYIISVDGTVAAYRFPQLLAGNSLVFKSDSQYYEHFYSKLEEFKHYIPFNEGNLMERLRWAEENGHNQTLAAMKQFVYDHLQPKNVFCYFARFLKEYTAKLLWLPSEPTEGMEAAETEGGSCECEGGREEL